MKKTYKIDVDCANCANKMEEAARKTEGVQSCHRELHGAEDDRGIRGGAGPQGRDGAGPQKLQKGGGRLRNLPVSAFFRKAPPPEAGVFFPQNN